MKALITGIFGQDGSYLAELLSDRGYTVHGVARMPLSADAARIRGALAAKAITPVLHPCDLGDAGQVASLIVQQQFDECYHTAAQHQSSEVKVTAGDRHDTAMYAANLLPALNLLGAIASGSPQTKVVLAGSCLMYVGANETPQSERTKPSPRSMYGVAKAAMVDLASYYRVQAGLHVSTAILFNHESPRRGRTFVTKRIVEGLGQIRRGEIASFALDNLATTKDWGFARDYAHGMTLMCAHTSSRDYVLATGRSHTVADFIDIAASYAGVPDWPARVTVRNPHPTGTPATPLVGDPSDAQSQLGWKHSLSFSQLIEHMVDCEYRGTLG